MERDTAIDVAFNFGTDKKVYKYKLSCWYLLAGQFVKSRNHGIYTCNPMINFIKAHALEMRNHYLGMKGHEKVC